MPLILTSSETRRPRTGRCSSASYFAWLPLEEEVRADDVAAALLREGISVSTAEPFSTAPHSPHALRLALGSVPLATLRDALHKVRRVIEDRTY